MHPEAEVLTHPECAEAVLKVFDYIGSTSGIIRMQKKVQSRNLLFVRENECVMNWKREIRGKKFYFTKTEPVCHDMKKVTLEKILQVLETGKMKCL